MALIPLEEPKLRQPPAGFALFALGFRPFFLGAGVFAVLLMGGWLVMLQGALRSPAGLSPTAWHGHEMLFGFGVAVIAGFLLTAAQNWTSVPMPSGATLAAFFVLWLAARLLPYAPGLPYVVAAVADLLFLPALALAVARAVLKVRQAPNYAFPLMLLALFAANGLFQAAALGWARASTGGGLYLGLYLVVLMMVVMGGRVIPYFTERRVNFTARKWQVVEWLAPGLTLAVMALGLMVKVWGLGRDVLALAAGAAALLHLIRLAGWQDRRLWRVPLLWVLHLGYGWIAIGFALDALAAAGVVSPYLALHAYGTGAMGVLTLGMMARVALGHTGRSLEPAKIMAWAFAAVNLAAAARVFGPLFLPTHLTLHLQISGWLWMAAFAVFTAVYAPILWRPRVDGRPG
jgi:uncharacterized protein involved in response to NO